MSNFLGFSLLAFITTVVPVPDPQRLSEPKSFTNTTGMKFVWIPPGSFVMGSPMDEIGRGDDETQYKLKLTKGFYMGVYLVTQEQWQEVTGKNPSKFKGEKKLPVDSVSWDDCQEFARKLAMKDKKPYRLPSEVEWEYACRAGTTTPFYFGETISTDQANFDGGTAYGNGKLGVQRGKTTPVGSFPPNAFGLYDMHGNLYQWCQDWYVGKPERREVDPQPPEKTGRAPYSRVLRGGFWESPPWSCRSARRYGDEPNIGGCIVGFRLCFNAPPTDK